MCTIWRPRRPSGHVNRMSGLAHRRSVVGEVLLVEAVTVLGEVSWPGFSEIHNVKPITLSTIK